ncbi:nicotinic acetylcholine receptor alpha 9b subunit [Reticulomyxa filosa]|uniref:Nicotinic acetylcholine receptor alpha 9b subunit n=1 Tax=Reticulomyxa filosa TaxID=46433 RepID=X6N902_RETFI|nr:nicotinic acetylcholine receptor alpha 9b subunit [Reticulomyxa filosa]|eukprot:ETO22521.1 nicotinic acetylcholine receptor alpha 9b subunit [Reticulomyxa filosa]
MRFHIYFNWLATKEDYLMYCVAKDAANAGDVEKLIRWEPKWSPFFFFLNFFFISLFFFSKKKRYPHLEFQNAIEEQLREWEEYPEEGRFRIQTFADFGKEKSDKIPSDQFDSSCAKFIRAKLECEMTFAEELELQAFPFDCQDLSCVIHERTTGGVRCIFLPELRNPNFASIDPRYSVIDEWDLETAILEFGDADAKSSRAGSSYAMIVLRLKVKRRAYPPFFANICLHPFVCTFTCSHLFNLNIFLNFVCGGGGGGGKMIKGWKVFLWNIQFLMACICGLALTAFSLSGLDNLGNRLNLLITLILTAVAFTFVVFDNLPNVPYLTYMNCVYLFVCVIQNHCLKKKKKKGQVHIIFIRIFSRIDVGKRICNHFQSRFGFLLFHHLFDLLILYHIAFLVYAAYVRKEEEQKLAFSSDEVEQEVNLLRPSLHFDYTKRLRSGNDGRLLSFIGMMAIPEAMSSEMQEQVKKNQEKLEKMYKARAEKFRAAAEKIHEERKQEEIRRISMDKKHNGYVEVKAQKLETIEDVPEKKDSDMGKKESDLDKKESDIGAVGMAYMRNNSGV